MSAWVLPDQIADVLPSEARHIEDLRRVLLDAARAYGYELVIPPMLEHLDSLLTGTGEALDLQTFKLVDQLSGRSLGLRADTTPQVARIDAHLLNRKDVTRLCYCGPVLHTRVDRPHVTREPLQLGAEIYGHKGLEADLEVIELALTSLKSVGLERLSLDFGDVRVVDAVLGGQGLPTSAILKLHSALAAKDVATIDELSASLSPDLKSALRALPHLYGDASVLDEAVRVLPASEALETALNDLRWLSAQITDADVSFDLADLRGYAYYTGVRFSLFGAADKQQPWCELVRGGRYDEVGAVFGRKRPAVGFSMDLKELAGVSPRAPLQPAIRAPWGVDGQLREAVRQLRSAGNTVVCSLPGHEHEVDEFHCNRVLVQRNGQWVVEPLGH